MAKGGIDFRGLNKEPQFEKVIVYVGLMPLGIKTINKDSKSVCPVCGCGFEVNENAVTIKIAEYSRAYHVDCSQKLATTLLERFRKDVNL